MNGDKFKETLGTFTRIAIPHFCNLFYRHLEQTSGAHRSCRSPGVPVTAGRPAHTAHDANHAIAGPGGPRQRDSWPPRQSAERQAL